MLMLGSFIEIIIGITWPVTRAAIPHMLSLKGRFRIRIPV